METNIICDSDEVMMEALVIESQKELKELLNHLNCPVSVSREDIIDMMNYDYNLQEQSHE